MRIFLTSLAVGACVGMLLWGPSAVAAGRCGGEEQTVEGETLHHVTEAQATCPWAFTTAEIGLSCKGASGSELLIAAAPDGTVYALNGLAKMRLKISALDAIWKEDPKLPGIKVNIDPWMSAARDLCR